jgi:hypothetical protein
MPFFAKKAVDVAADFEASTQVCANCGGDYKVELRTPDMDIEPVPLCLVCVVAGFDWREKLVADGT